MTRAAIVTAVAALVVPVAPVRADTMVAQLPTATPISAYGGVLAWSRYDARDRRYHLQGRVHGRVMALPVAARPVPFDVDLGPGPQGGVVAVYSRCSRNREPGKTGPPSSRRFEAQYARGCSLWRYDFARRRQARLARLGRPGWSETHPAIWKDRIAFAAARDPRRPDARATERVYRASVHGASRSRVVVEAIATRRLLDNGVQAMDLRGSRLAFARASDEDAGLYVTSGDAARKPGTVPTVGGRGQSIEGVGFDGRSVVYGSLSRDQGSTFSEVWRLDPSLRPRLVPASLAAPPGCDRYLRPHIGGVAADRGTVYYVRTDPCAAPAFPSRWVTTLWRVGA